MNAARNEAGNGVWAHSKKARLPAVKSASLVLDDIVVVKCGLLSLCGVFKGRAERGWAEVVCI